MSRIKVSIIVSVAILLFVGVAVFNWKYSSKNSLIEKLVSQVVVTETPAAQKECFKPKTFVMTPEKMMENYSEQSGEAFKQEKDKGISDSETQKKQAFTMSQMVGTVVTKVALDQIYEDQPDFFLVSTEQDPGVQVKVKKVELQKAGIIVVGSPLIGSVDEGKFIASYPIQAGKYEDLSIPLNRYMDRYEAYVKLYEDDGDGIFDSNKDTILTYRRKSRTDKYSFNDPASIKVHFKTDRSYTEYQSVYHNNPTKWDALSVSEQLPGNIVNINVARSYRPVWVAIHESDNGCVGRILGSYSLEKPSYIDHWQDDSFDIQLSREVKDETLFAIMYEDNGDEKFDLSSDMPMRGVGNQIIGVEFPVIAGRELSE